MTSDASVDPSESGAVASQDARERNAIAIRGGALRVAGYLSGVLVSLGAAAILVRHLGVAEFGRYVTVVSLVSLVGGVTEAGIGVFGIREFAGRGPDERRRLLADLIGLRLTLAAIGIGCAACFGVIVGYGDALVLGTLMAGCGLLAQVVADVLSIPLQAELRLGSLTLVDLARRAVMLVLIAALASLGAKLLPFFAVSIAAGLVALAILMSIVRRSASARISWDRRRWRGLLSETLPFALSVSIGAIYFYVTIIVLSLIASSLQTGYFATSFRVTQVALAVPALLLTAVFPLIAAGRAELSSGMAARMGRVFEVAIVCGVYMSVTMVLGARFIIEVIAGHRAAGAVSVLQIQAAVLTASFVSASSMFGLLALHRYRPMLLASTIALVFNVVLGLLLIPSLGARGGAIADLATETLVAAGLAWSLKRAAPGLVVAAGAAPRAALAAAPAIAMAFVPISPIARAALGTLLYAGVLHLAGGIPVEVRRAAGSALTMRRR